MSAEELRTAASSDTQPAIRRGRLDQLSIYEISEAELNTLAQGTSNSLCLNFGLSFLSIGASFLVTLLSVPSLTERLFTVFVCVCVICLALGPVLLCFWFRSYRAVGDIVRTIRERIQPEGVQQPVPSVEGSTAQPAATLATPLGDRTFR